MQLNALRARLGDGGDEVARIQESVSRCLEETRQALRGLRQAERADDRLGPALARLGQRLRGGAPAVVDVMVAGTPRRLPHAVEDELYRIAQEALTNALKHATASRIEVRLAYQADGVALRIADDGRGFDAATAAAGPPGHFGLLGMHERAHQIGGDLRIAAGAAGGTVVEVLVKHAPEVSDGQ
jgi:signal transduction histidine kinase